MNFTIFISGNEPLVLLWKKQANLRQGKVHAKIVCGCLVSFLKKNLYNFVNELSMFSRKVSTLTWLNLNK
jgi:hypothetical protein